MKRMFRRLGFRGLGFKYAVIALLITYHLLLTTSLKAQRDEIITDTSNTQGWFYGLKAANLKSNNKVTYTDPLGNVRISTIDVASLGDQLNDGFITGGIVTYSGTGLTFDVSPAIYYINGTRYTSNAGSITLNAADATNDRIDVIALDNTGTIVKITGIASANPIEPQTDPNTQIKLTTITVSAGSTTPSNITSTIVYDENVEWAATSSGTIAANFNGTVNNFHGSKNTTVTSWANGSQIIYINSGTITVSGTNTLKAFFRLSNSLTSGQNIFAQLYNGANAVSGTVNLSSYGLNRSSVGAYQNVSVPFNAFKLKSNTFDRVVFGFSGSNGNIVNLDYVQIQGGITTSGTSSTDSAIYATKWWTTQNFQPIGNYLTSQVNSDWNAASGAALILNKPDLSGYLTKAIADGYYQTKLALTAGRVPYTNASGLLSTTPNLAYDSASGVMTLTTNSNVENGIVVQNTNNGLFSASQLAVKNSAGMVGGFEMYAPAFNVTSARGRLGVVSWTAMSFYTNSNVSKGGTDAFRFYAGGSDSSNGALSIFPGGHVAVGDTADTHPADTKPYLSVHKIYVDSCVGCGTGSSSSGSQTLSIAGNVLSISNGNSVTLPSGGGSTNAIQEITTGTAVTLNTKSDLVINPGAAIAAFTATLPASPSVGDIARIVAGGTIAGGNTVVNAITINPNTGQTITQSSSPSLIVSGDAIIYEAISTTRWYRIK